MKYSQSAVNNYQKKNYYKVSVNFPAKYKDEIQKAAASRGVSVSSLVTEIVGKELGLDLMLSGVLPTLKGEAQEGGG